MKEPLPRLDHAPELREKLMPLCRLAPGEVWTDPERGHRVGVLDGCSRTDVDTLLKGLSCTLAVNDPPYNITVGSRNTPQLFSSGTEDYLEFTAGWVEALLPHMAAHSHFYLWIGADQTRGFQPLPDVMLLLRKYPELKSRSFITLRNQRGYGTQKNWMCARQELLYYTLGDPPFQVAYTEIPRILKGYYKEVGGERSENSRRSRSPFIRPGNVWVDIQQVFYRMEENVPGAYAQKPLSSIERLLVTSSRQGDTVADLFAHSGTTLLAAELHNRRCCTMDIDPVFAELAIRRLEHYRKTGRKGWQCAHPFPELEVRDPSGKF